VRFPQLIGDDGRPNQLNVYEKRSLVFRKKKGENEGPNRVPKPKSVQHSASYLIRSRDCGFKIALLPENTYGIRENIDLVQLSVLM